MTIKQLEYFEKVYEHQSIFKAAEELYLSQQGLSRALASMEQEFGEPLFLRTHKGVYPTPLGQELHVSCQATLHDVAALEQHIAEFQHRQDHSCLKIGLGAGCRYFNSQVIWKKFFKRYPHMTFSIKEYPYKKGAQLLSDNELDILIISDYTPDENYINCEIKCLNRVLLINQKHPLSHNKSISMKDLKDEVVMLSCNDFAFDIFDSYCKQRNLLPREVYRVSENLYLYDACNQDECVGITIDGYFTDVYLTIFPELRTVPFRENIFPYNITLIARKNHPNRVLIDALATYLKEDLKSK